MEEIGKQGNQETGSSDLTGFKAVREPVDEGGCEKGFILNDRVNLVQPGIIVVWSFE